MSLELDAYESEWFCMYQVELLCCSVSQHTVSGSIRKLRVKTLHGLALHGLNLNSKASHFISDLMKGLLKSLS